MDIITEQDIRSSFINCSKGAAKRLPVPTDLSERPWEDMDFLGWTEPNFAGRCYVAVPQGDQLVGVALRHQQGSSRRAQMCSICLTTHGRGGVELMAAQKAGASGRQGNTVGTYICSDLACSLYARRKKSPSAGRQHREDFDVDDRAATVRQHMDVFVARIRG